jgi:hypothetical protein
MPEKPAPTMMTSYSFAVTDPFVVVPLTFAGGTGIFVIAFGVDFVAKIERHAQGY